MLNQEKNQATLRPIFKVEKAPASSKNQSTHHETPVKDTDVVMNHSVSDDLEKGSLENPSDLQPIQPK